jgi:hypothetical protein
VSNTTSPGAAVSRRDRATKNGPPFLPSPTGPDVPLCIYCGSAEVKLTGLFRPAACSWLGVRFRLCAACVDLAGSDSQNGKRVCSIIEANSEAVANGFLDTFISDGLAHDIKEAIDRHAKLAAPARVDRRDLK